jgi:hypothetical protein
MWYNICAHAKRKPEARQIRRHEPQATVTVPSNGRKSQVKPEGKVRPVESAVCVEGRSPALPSLCLSLPAIPFDLFVFLPFRAMPEEAAKTKTARNHGPTGNRTTTALTAMRFVFIFLHFLTPRGRAWLSSLAPRPAGARAARTVGHDSRTLPR